MGVERILLPRRGVEVSICIPVELFLEFKEARIVLKPPRVVPRIMGR